MGQPFRIGSDDETPPVSALSVFSAKQDGVAVHGGGGDFFGLGCLFLLEDHHARVMRELLPSIMHIAPGEPGQEALRISLDRLLEEARRPQPGSRLIMQHLSQMMLIQALRLQMAVDAPDATSWLAAFRDRRLSPVLAAMHHSPEYAWSLRSLAARAGMSRTAFSVHFKAMTGVSPMDYLTRWRMLQAEARLRAGEPVADIAHAVDYASESAFGVAFRRVMGRPPRRATSSSARP